MRPEFITKLAWCPDHELANASMVDTDVRAEIEGFAHGWGARLAAVLIGARCVLGA